jgi:two-component system cell cycle sensor histidine kinase/response regulator CckA
LNFMPASGSQGAQLAQAMERKHLPLLPLVVLAVLASGLLILALLKEPVIAGGFAAVTIAGVALIWFARRLFPAVELDQAVVMDWTVTRAAAEGAGVAIAITDRTGRIVCASDQYGELFPGYPTPAEVKVSGRDKERLIDAGRVAWRDGQSVASDVQRGALHLDVEVQRTGRDDDYLIWRFLTVRQSSILDDYLRVVEGEAGQQISQAGIMCAMIGAEGRVRAANPAFVLRATGRSDTNMVGRDLAGYMRVDDKGRIFFSQDEDERAPVRMFQIPLRPEDPMSLLMLVMVDDPVTNLAGFSSLSYVEALVPLLPFGLGVADRDGRLLLYNKAFARAAGVLESDAQFSYPGDLVVSEDQAVVADAVRRYAIGPQMSGDIQVRLRAQPDEPVSLNLAGIRGLGDAAVLLSLKDNSEESRLKRQVAQQTKMQAVGQLAGGVAHDFNNILTAIIGHCDLMLMRHTPGDTDYDDIQQVRANSNRAAALTRQLLAFSRQQTLRPQVLQLPDVVSEVSSLLKRLLGENISLDVTHGRNLGAVRADPGQLEQVIVNLVVNARDAMPEGGVVSIRTFTFSAAQVRAMKNDFMSIGDYTGLSVSDTGVGIAPDFIGKIFEPFFTTKEVGKGTGLGLSTVYGIVKQSGGFIFADSEVGVGTTFTIYLPVHAIEAEDPERRAATQRKVSTDTWGTGTILLVEDEDMVRSVAERALTRQGYTVITANDGEQGLARMAQAEKIDMLISDVVMPGMDGPAMVRAIRATHPLIPVLFMSGYAEEQLRKSIDIENVAFLPKPFSVKQLAEAARDVLGAARERATLAVAELAARQPSED